MIDGSRSKASGIGAKSQGGNAVTVVAEDPGSGGGAKRIVNGNGDIGRGGSEEVLGLLVPNDGAEGRAPSFVCVGLPQLHRSDLHGENGIGSGCVE